MIKKICSSKSRGFTLMELLIVIAIIGILVTIAAASLSSAQKKARDSRRRGDLNAFKNAMEQYYSDNNGSYVDTCSPGVTYLPSGLPTDPKTGDSYSPECTDTTYCMCATMESGNDTTTDCNGDSQSSMYCVHNLQ